ncbi:DUF885 family protein [Elongatibacter sediminis]|uniref:DUF885 family protein n=1 Tax=Elongatibacter sediminis TaxID=3119006 RepID=A0AAW9R7B9_9GAMM
MNLSRARSVVVAAARFVGLPRLPRPARTPARNLALTLTLGPFMASVMALSGPSRAFAETGTEVPAASASPDARPLIEETHGPAAGELAEARVPELNADLQKLAAAFFEWRAGQRPVVLYGASALPRPADWLPAWSPSDLAVYRAMYRDFLDRLAGLDHGGYSRADDVDARLLAAAIKQVGWELDALRRPHRDPLFYVDQTLGSILPLGLPGALDEAAAREVLLLRLQHFGETLLHARENLTEPVRPLAVAAVERLVDIESRLAAWGAAIAETGGADSESDQAAADPLVPALADAGLALADYRRWLQQQLAGMNPDPAIGREAYQWYLANVALMPETPQAMADAAERALDRQGATSVLDRHRHRDVPPAAPMPSPEAFIHITGQQERELRAFLAAHELLTVPADFPASVVHAVPATLAALAPWGKVPGMPYGAGGGAGDNTLWFLLPGGPGTTDGKAPFFDDLAWRDPRLRLVGDVVPGWRLQRHLTASHPDPIRRYAMDFATSPGIAAWFEDVVHSAGLWDYSPQVRPWLYRLLRLRALQAVVDVGLSNGDLSLAAAVERLQREVPMDRSTAGTLAIAMASNPGSGAAAFAGAGQVAAFVAAWRETAGEDFDLKAFHDRLLREANVPIALQRWEELGDGAEVARLKQLGRRPATVPQ